MKCFVRLSLSLCLFVALAGWAQAEKPAPSPEPSKAKQGDAAKAKDKGDKDEKKKEGGEQPIDVPIPAGEPVKGLKVPQYDEKGNLQFMLDAETARKTDDTHIELENSKIDAYGEDGKKFYIELPRSVFNLETRIVDSPSRVFIRREDFEITGDSGQFHVKTRFAKIIGNVKMIIFSIDTSDKGTSDKK